ncbi:DUF2384 domain-containing protein [Stenotrophomonas sp. ISL-67]|uniref:MbcA/ParS/Xre antitoxin family protein n=1 Tax=Stenotrophomonas sp. ISL-67 TaxID=2819171 RepID=UPI001BE9F42E|nr:MbcA/ParS/Xre antitoxin family protein [Stenotrophomonas sp. ISL-67]MBT2767822.1 DUF2384 domain-containing protein [Stenotrophomonas sp. ISL-67]
MHNERNMAGDLTMNQMKAEVDGALRVTRVTREAARVFGSDEKATRWLSAANGILGAKPMDLLVTVAGARDVEHELARIDHGNLA